MTLMVVPSLPVNSLSVSSDIFGSVSVFKSLVEKNMSINESLVARRKVAFFLDFLSFCNRGFINLTLSNLSELLRNYRQAAH
jgi:hypothetical protein